MALKPPFAYFGGKMGLADRILGLLPPHRVYIEPYFGSGAVLMAKQPAIIEIVNDLDDALVTFWQILRNRPDDLAHVCALTPHSRTEFDRAANLHDPDLDELEIARRVWIRINQSFAKTTSTNTGWSITASVSRPIPTTNRNRILRFHELAARLAGVSIECCDAPTLIDRLATTDDTAVYVDPPYLAATRKGRTGKGGDYRFDAGRPEHHERLAEALHKTPANVVLSGYPSPMYDRLYRDWERLDLPVTTHSSKAARGGRTDRVECLWTNFDVGYGQLAFDAG